MGNNQFTIKFMGTPKIKNHDNFFTENGFDKDYEDIGLFPGNIENVKGNLENTLFVNAWDMLSVVGNGNALDVSLDGFIGRNTSVAILSTSLTNPYIKKYDNNPNYISVTNLTNPNFAINCSNIPKKEQETVQEPNTFQAENIQLRDKICSNLFTVTGGIFSGYDDNNENNWVIIDPAGTAFQNGSTTYQGGGLSGAIYNKFGITGQPHGYNSNLPYCSANISTANLSGKVRAMIHAIGPDGRLPDYNTPDKFYNCLRNCIFNIADRIRELEGSQRLDKDTQIRIPLISSSIYDGDIVSSNMERYFSELSSNIENYLCPIGYNIVVALFSDQEIISFQNFYDSITFTRTNRSQTSNSSPLKLKKNTKYLSPTSKIRNSRDKKKNKLKKLKIK